MVAITCRAGGSLRPAHIDWSQDAPASIEFGDIYFSRAGGLAETRYVFLAQNQLAERFAGLTASKNFTLIETGFGTGLNWMATLALWQKQSPQGWLHYVSVEKHPFTPLDLQRAQACWPELSAFASALQAQYPALLPGFHHLLFPQWRSTLTLFYGDVATFFPQLTARADAWFLDGFAPSRNPAMWTPTLYQALAEHSHEGATLATFTAAGRVRRGLMAASFSVEKVAGFGSKREMLRARFNLPTMPLAIGKPWLYRPPYHGEKKALIIGAGIAGAATAARLALRGWQVQVFEAATVAAGASGNPAAMLYPPACRDSFQQQAYQFTLRELTALAPAYWHPCGVLKLLTRTPAQSQHQPSSTYLSASAASQYAGIPLPCAALWHPEAGWLEAVAYCQQLLQYPGISVQLQTRVLRVEQSASGWRVFDAVGNCLATTPLLIIANAAAAHQFSQTQHLPLQAVRGQVSTVAASVYSKKLRTVLCHEGYISPPLSNGQHCIGATFYPEREDTEILMAEHEENRQLLSGILPELAHSLPTTTAWLGRAAVRCQSPDYRPLVGPIADPDSFANAYAGLKHGRIMRYPLLESLPGLYVNLAHGSKGFNQALLAAEILAAELNNEPAPVANTILESLHPMRFRARQIKRG